MHHYPTICFSVWHCRVYEGDPGFDRSAICPVAGRKLPSLEAGSGSVSWLPNLTFDGRLLSGRSRDTSALPRKRVRQFPGKSSSTWTIGYSAMRSSTKRRYASASKSLSLADPLTNAVRTRHRVHHGIVEEPSSSTSLRMRNFWIFPVTVMGKASTKRT